MLRRKAKDEMLNWKNDATAQALLVTGARQVGKTYLIEAFCRENFAHVVKFDMVDQRDIRDAFDAARSTQELFLTMSAYAGDDFVPGQTVVFIDEIQECKEALTLVKYLVQRTDFAYVLSGSLLGVELSGVRPLPAVYVLDLEMHPLDFEEFCWANNFGADAWFEAQDAFANCCPVLTPVHERLITLFHWYLVVGGMPQAVSEFVDSQNIASVRRRQNDIIELYRYDISKYAKENRRLAIREIFDQMPSQLNSQSKRFNFSALAPKGTYERYQEDFIWMVDAGVSIVVRNVSEPKKPLRLAEERSFFKLFMNDVGLLSASCEIDTVRNILANDTDVNYGAIYENVVAQELVAHGFEPRFFRNRKQGELDFVVEEKGRVLPIEVKSGKSYKRHSALDNVLATENYGITRAIVLCEDNVSTVNSASGGKIAYLPVYMVSFLKKPTEV